MNQAVLSISLSAENRTIGFLKLASVSPRPLLHMCVTYVTDAQKQAKRL